MNFKFRHTEDSHVKTNIVHTLFKVQKYGVMSIDQFTNILGPADLKRCKKSQKNVVFVTIIYVCKFHISGDFLV
jgi:hypothetical protein